MNETELREQALKQLKKKADFRMHLFTYVVINALIVAVWALTGSGFFWPVFPMLGWGIGVAFQGFDAYSTPPTESDIEHEMNRLRRAH